ncbi:MAG: hypothetical protein ACE5E8_05270 [Acidimicrobiia bacterium]
MAVIADSVGTGPDPEEGVFDEIIMVDVTATSVMDAVRGYQAALLNLSPEAAAALDRFDPAGDALVMPAMWQTDEPVGGRPIYGGRPEDWRRLEDKILVAGLLEGAGIELAPYEIVDLASADVLSVHLRLDRGMGTIWVADNREGWHGGGEMMRWARTAAELDRAVWFLSGHADRARAMPFLDGIPCSIHGIVTPDYVVSGRPVEMVVLRSPDGLQYCGAATSWMAKEDDEAAMRTGGRKSSRRRSSMCRGATPFPPQVCRLCNTAAPPRICTCAGREARCMSVTRKTLPGRSRWGLPAWGAICGWFSAAPGCRRESPPLPAPPGRSSWPRITGNWISPGSPRPRTCAGTLIGRADACRLQPV